MSKIQLCLTLRSEGNDNITEECHAVVDRVESIISGIKKPNRVTPDQIKTDTKEQQTDNEIPLKMVPTKGKRGRKKKINNKQQIKKEDKPKCMARIASGEQCHRSRNTDKSEDFCTCHEKHCPYGRIDGPFEGKFLNVPKKRGPKFKNSKEYKLEELDHDLYIQTQLLKIDGKCFLIDINNGILFSNDNNCEIVGRRMKNEIHWYV